MAILKNETEFDTLGPFEDEVDCAILDDEDFKAAMEEIGSADSTSEEEMIIGEPTDVSIDYSETVPEPDMVSIDADEMIGAERELVFDPFADDELVDAAVGEINIDDIDLDED